MNDETKFIAIFVDSFFVAGKLMTVRQMTGHQNIIKLLSYLFVTINIYHLFTL